MPPEKVTVPYSWRRACIPAASIVVAIFVLSFFWEYAVEGMSYLWIAGKALSYAGALYTVCFLFWISLTWKSFPLTGEIEPLAEGIPRFATGNQRVTLLLNGVLLGLWVALLLCFLRVIPYPVSFSLTVAGCSVLIAAGVGIFILNVRWGGLHFALPSENQTIRDRLGAWRLIVISRVMAMAVWILYGLGGIPINLLVSQQIGLMADEFVW